MTTPARIAQGLAHTAVHTAVHTVRHPVSSAARVVGLARGAVHAVREAPGIVADTVSTRDEKKRALEEVPPPEPAVDRTPEAEPESSQPAAPADSPSRAPSVVPDLEPPDPDDRVLVVEEALASAGEQPRFGRTTEPHAASRDEEHGESALDPAEIEELEEEAEARE